MARWLFALAWPSCALPGDGLAKKPPMGYNSWNDLECKPSEQRLLAIAEKLKRLGFLELGYEYVVVDDCWMISRANGQLKEDTAAFPSGMKALGEHLHNLGFKYGIYTDRGLKTCASRPASLGFEDVDGRLFASWNVDFLKNDGCVDPDCGDFLAGYPQSGQCNEKGKLATVSKYRKMANALNSSGRPIVHSICGWNPWFAGIGRHIGHLWRVTADVRNWKGVYEASRVMEKLLKHHGPSGWNDPDMLIGSSAGAKLVLTAAQSRAQFSLWAVMSAPLMLGVNVMKITDYDVETYRNVDAIRINQDSAYLTGRVVFSNCPTYPGFQTGQKPDGAPSFDILWPGGSPRVNCGGHVAKDCASCGDSRDMCKGSCKWQSPPGSRTKSLPICMSRSNTSALTQVSCGGHHASSCGECPQGNGRNWCNKDCIWYDEGRCVPNTHQRYEDRWEPWTLGEYTEESQRQCQLAWAKWMSTGETAVVATNFARRAAMVEIPLSVLMNKEEVRVRNVWSGHERVQPGDQSLRLKLEANGGHILLLLEAADGTNLTQDTVIEWVSEAEGRQRSQTVWELARTMGDLFHAQEAEEGLSYTIPSLLATASLAVLLFILCARRRCCRVRR